MKAIATKLLVVVAVLALSYATGDDSNTKQQSLRDLTDTTTGSNTEHHHSQLRGSDLEQQQQQQQQRNDIEQPLPEITQLVWMRSDTNQRTSVDGSVFLVPNNSSTPIYIDLDFDPIRNLTVEAITSSSASTGSVIFTMSGYYSDVYYHVEDKARYVMCGNAGDNVLQCPGTTFPFYDVAKLLSVTPYSGKSATGVPGTSWNIYLSYKINPFPNIKVYLVNPVTDYIYMDKPLAAILNEPGNSWITDPSLGKYFNFLLSATAWTQYPDLKTWLPSKVEFILDNGAYRRTDLKAPFSAFGNTGNDYNLYELSNGRHTLEVRIFKTNDELGEILETAFTIRKPN